LIMETTMIPGIMMQAPGNNPEQTPMSLEHWSYENFKKKHQKKPVEIQGVKCIVDGKETIIPFDAFAIHVSHMMDRIGIWPKEKANALYKKYPVTDLYNNPSEAIKE